jgi:hypothetical protein
MAVWEYKVISSGKGGFATPALLESFLNQLGKDEWEIIEFRGQPDNALAFSGLARRSTQRDWTLEDAVAAAARAEADKLRTEFEAKFRNATAAAPAAEGAEAEARDTEAGREVDGLRRLRDTEHDADPDAPDAVEDEWDKLGSDDELPTFFEAMRPHMRKNQRGPGQSVGVDYLAKKWDMNESEVLGALKECGLEIPEDEDAKVVYVEYDGDLFWVNVNRRGELWVNTKEKTRPVFRTVAGVRVEPEEQPQRQQEPQQDRPQERRQERRREEPAAAPDDGTPAKLPEGPALLERILPLMRKNRREPGASGSTSFLSRALRVSESALVEAFAALGLASMAESSDSPAPVDFGDSTWWLNKDSRGGIWINTREKRSEGGAAPEAAAGDTHAAAPAPGNVFAAVRLLLKGTKSGGVAATVERLASELGKSTDEFLAALTASGLKVPQKAREKPVFGEHAGEIFWLNRNGKGELWLNAKVSKYASGEGRGRKGQKRGPEEGDGAAPAGEPVSAEPQPETAPAPAAEAPQAPAGETPVAS